MRTLLIATVLSFGMATFAWAETVHVGVDGLVCAFCAKGIESSFKKHDSVESVTVDMEKKQVTLLFKKDAAMNDDTIRQVITDAGYNATTIHRQEQP